MLQPLGRCAAPGSCWGGTCGEGMPTSWHAVSHGPGVGGVGREGTFVLAGAPKLKADVMSPVTDRRQAVRLGTRMPVDAKRLSMNRSIDVWSSTSEHTNPPRLFARLKGEITSMGTRMPSPIGAATVEGVA